MQSLRRPHLAAGLLAAAFLMAATGCGADRPEGSVIPPVAEPAVMTGADAATVDTPFSGPTVLVGTEVFGWVPDSGDWQRFTMTG